MPRARFPALVLALLLAVPSVASDGWTEFNDSHGVRSFYKQIPGSRVLAMKGVGELEAPIGKVLGVVLDGSKSTEWVDMLVEYRDARESPTVTVEYQRYDMPWPIWDREFVLRRTDSFDAASRTVGIRYRSVDDARFPVASDAVRGQDSGSFWQFTALPNGHTHVEIEVFVDPKGDIPVWLVNTIQKGWPRETFAALGERARRSDVVSDPRVAGW